jgi:hypothetical protein
MSSLGPVHEAPGTLNIPLLRAYSFVLQLQKLLLLLQPLIHLHRFPCSTAVQKRIKKQLQCGLLW